jgi:hypothetical protein
MWATITGDFALARDYDGTTDGDPTWNEDVRFWVGTERENLSTTDDEWDTLLGSD